MTRAAQTMKRINGRQIRPTESINIVPKFLIVCEGQKTEVLYFEAFPVSTEPDVVEVIVHGTGFNTVSLVNEAIRLCNQANYDQVWCVFDRDSFPIEHFNSAIALARNNDMFVAYSNEAFELWYLLHYGYYHTAITRASYCERLSTLMQKDYKKNSKTLYQDLLHLQSNALKFAKKLLDSYKPHDPVKDNPCTTVHLLVLELNKYIK